MVVVADVYPPAEPLYRGAGWALARRQYCFHTASLRTSDEPASAEIAGPHAAHLFPR